MPDVLDMHIRPGRNNNFSVELYEWDHTQPLARAGFDYDLSFMTDFEISRLDSKPKTPYERLEQRRAFGNKLYRKLFTPEIEKTWQKYKDKSDFLVLCLRIAPEAEKLEVLPWETLYDSEEFIAAGARTGMTRLPLDILWQKDLPPLPRPIHMLALLSSPLDLKESERLAIEKEQEILLQATNSPAGQGRLKVDFEDEAKLQVIESTMESGYQIFHYSGHGIDPKYGGGLLWEDPGGKKRLTRAEEVLQTLDRGIKNFRLVVLSGCQTARTLYTSGFQDLARELARRKVPAVIAMQFSITDEGGLLFAKTLYPLLAEGQPLEIAVSAGRRALLQSDEPGIQADALAPVLILSGTGPLKTKAGESALSAYQVRPEFDYYVPLPRLNFGFYGRRREYRAIRDGLLNKNQRAIIVHGIGGIGKTALVSHAASRLKENFKGIYAFECRSGTLAPETILLELHRFLERMQINALGQLMHQSFPPYQLAEFMGQVLSQVPMLIIFDNFETQLSFQKGKHQINDPNLKVFLEMLIKTASQGSCFLFTSRYIFEIDEKRVSPVQYLPLVDLSRPEALWLMQNLPHLRAVSYGEQLEVFEVFGGHPYGLVTLDRHCGQKSLWGALKDAKDIHLELREFLAIEINYTRLSGEARELLNRLAAFRKPVKWEAVHWVMGKPFDIPANFFKLLIKRVRKKIPKELQNFSNKDIISIFRHFFPEKRPAEGVDEPVRELTVWGLLTPLEENGEIRLLTVHTLVRDFCRGKCQGTWNQYVEDAAAYYMNRSKHIKQDRKILDSVLEEIEAAELLMESSDFEQAAGIIANVTELLSRWGLGRMAEKLIQQLIPLVKKEMQSILINNLGISLHGIGDYQEALKQYRKSLKIAKELGDRGMMARVMLNIGVIHYMRSDYEPALKQQKKSMKIFEEVGDRDGLAKSVHLIGNIYLSTGKSHQAINQYQRVLEIAEEIENRSLISRVLHQIGMIHQEWSDYPAALKHYEKSLKILREIGDRAGMASSLHQIGNIHYICGDYPAALEQYEESLKIKEELGDRDMVAFSLHQIAMIHHDLGDFLAAMEMYKKSLKIFEELGNHAGVASSMNQIGMIHHMIGDHSAAVKYYEKSLKIFEEIGEPAGVSKLLHQIGIIHYDRGNYHEALELYEKSLKISEELGNRAGVATSLHQIGRTHHDRETYQEAMEMYIKSLTIFAELQSPDTKIAINNLINLRTQWGADHFDASWQEKTGKEVPGFLKESLGK